MDCLADFEKVVLKEKIFSKDECEKIKKQYTDEAFEALRTVRAEPPPDPATIYDHVFEENE